MFYQELSILPASGMGVNHIWSKLYTQLHLALATRMNAEGREDGKGRIGVSFPDYDNGEKKGLGRKLRIFAYDAEDLKRLDIAKWLRNYKDYVHIQAVLPVPPDTGYAVYRRVHHKSNRNRAMRYAKRHDMSYGEALNLFPKEISRDLPFVRLSSETNHNSYRLSIEKIQQDAKVFAGFTSFGLDNHSTVPEF